VLYAGLARYEFQKVLHSLNLQANFVFVRDVHRIGFHLRPDGSPGGLAFYEEHLRDVMQRLGSSRNIAIGSSIGGGAALYFGTRCAMSQLIIFGAAFTLDGFTAPGTLLKTIFDVKKIFVEPRAYAEMLIVSISALWGSRQLAKRFGAENVARPLDVYRAAEPRPMVTLFYGATAWPDVRQAAMLGAIPGTTLIPLPTGRHNTPSFLKQHGRLADAIAQAIQ
jgi:pimeloyl-ACP methyl ester carboxylesterase